MKTIKYAEALNEALREEMRNDEKVFVFGQDVELGYAFGVCKGLIDEFGNERVFDTGIWEQTMLGTAVGSALMGYRPVVEIQFCDLLPMCMDQICNQAAKLSYMSGGQIKQPLVIRSPAGKWGGFAAQHSQTLDAWFIHVPGLKVAVPSTPYDAKGLLKTAIRDNNPVLFIEQKMLYPVLGQIPVKEYMIPFGEARIHRAGKDVTILSIGRMVMESLEAAEKLSNEGINCTVLDPRTLVPLDEQKILDSVSETHRVVIVEEGTKRGGVGAEISAIISENIFDELDAPILRIAAMDTPIPFSPKLEDFVFPDANKIVQVVRDLIAF